jgi:GTP:adenosylcobinamide-phosphate guanylyltransferase
MEKMKNESPHNSLTESEVSQVELVQVDALVMAGGDGSVIDPSVSAKGLVKVAGKPMVQWVVEALRKASMVREIAVVLPPGQDIESWSHLVDYVIESDGMISENVGAGVRALPRRGHVIVTTSDIPSVTPEAFDDFIAQSLSRGGDLSYPMIPEADMMTAYPGTQRTFFKLKEGKVTGGNALVFDSHQLEYLTELGQEVFEARKSPLKLANIVGARFAFKLITGKLTLADLEGRISDFAKLKCKALISHHASIGADVDKPEDLPAVEVKLDEMNKA